MYYSNYELTVKISNHINLIFIENSQNLTVENSHFSCSVVNTDTDVGPSSVARNLR